MFVNFSEEARHILKQAEKERDELNHPYVGSEHLFLSVLKSKKLNNIFKKNGITYEIFKKKLINIVGVGSKKSNFTLYTPLLKRIIENSIIEAREEKQKNVSQNLLILSILEEEDGIAYSILKNLNVNIDTLYYDIKNNETIKSNKKKLKLLNDLGVDLTLLAKQNKLDPTIGREDEINNVLKILLRRKKNNPILIGEAGVGKTAIVEGLANLISKGKCPKYLRKMKIISINIFSLVSGTKYRGEFEEKMKELILELENNKNIILFLDEIHTIVGAGASEGAIDASNILKPALARGNIKIIGATTLDEYKKYIEPDQALSRRFQNVYVNEPNTDNVIKILKNIKPIYEKHHNLKISDSIIEQIVKLSNKYLINRFEPDKSIDVLDEVCSYARLNEEDLYSEKNIVINKLNAIKKDKLEYINKKKYDLACKKRKEEINLINKLNIFNKPKEIKYNDIIEVIKSKANIAGILSLDNKYYDKIKEKLKKIVLGQNDIIDKLIYELKKRNVLNEKKQYSMIISGPKYSGKTLLSNSYMNSIFGDHVIKIDLSEYSESHLISKLIGTSAGYVGYDNKNNIFERIRLNPFYGIIVNNFEMGCPEVQNLFFKIIKEGKIEDSSGKVIDFSYTTIMFTIEDNFSKTLGFSDKKMNKDVDNKLFDLVDLKIQMQNIDENTTLKIVEKKLRDIVKKYNYFNIKYTKEYINYIVKSIKDTNMSQLNRIITNDFESQIANAIINNEKSIIIDKTSNVLI